MDPRAKLKADLLDMAEEVPPGVAAIVFCEMLTYSAKKMGLSERDFFHDVTSMIENLNVSFEDMTLLKPPQDHERQIERFDHLVKQRLKRFSPPSWETMSVLLSCIETYIRKGVPKELVFGMLHSRWHNSILMTAKLEKDVPKRDLNGLPAWMS